MRITKESKVPNKMYKKIIIPVVVFMALTSMAFYKVVKLENKEERKEAEVKEFVSEEEDTYAPIVVLELFTSQGCSSCPPADALLDQVKKKHSDKVFALSYHVDYWNYIGWTDPFSNANYSKKQNAYNYKFKSRSNYTPQVVVNGKEHFVGSNRSKLLSKITAYSNEKPSNAVGISGLKREGNSITVDYKLLGNLDGKDLRTVLVIDERTTNVKRGENRNRILKNSNIVVAENYSPIDGDTGKTTIEVPSLVNKEDKLTVLLLVENTEADITAAAKKKV